VQSVDWKTRGSCLVIIKYQDELIITRIIYAWLQAG